MTEQPRSRGVDALRAVAALTVLVMHAGLFPVGGPRPPHGLAQHLGWAVYWNLDLGVDVFFVLSGYLISWPFVRALAAGEPLPGTGRYAARRAARIFPAYWVALAAITLLPFVPWPAWMWGLHVSLLMNPFPGQLNHGLGVGWTLHLELAFYLLVPLVARRLRRHPPADGLRRLTRLVLGAMAASAVAAGAASFVPLASDWWRVANHSVPACLGLFGPGVLLAVARTGAGAPWLTTVLARLTATRALVAVLAVTTVVSLAAVLAPAPFTPLNRPFRATAAALVLHRVLDAEPGRVARALAPLGTVSYGIYLWHFVIQRDLEHYGIWYGAAGSFGLLVNAAVLLVLTLPFAVASWYLVERPALRLVRPRRRDVAGARRALPAEGG